MIQLKFQQFDDEITIKFLFVEDERLCLKNLSTNQRGITLGSKRGNHNGPVPSRILGKTVEWNLLTVVWQRLERWE